MVRSSSVAIRRPDNIAGANPVAGYARREPERTVLYQVVKDHVCTFSPRRASAASMASASRASSSASSSGISNVAPCVTAPPASVMTTAGATCWSPCRARIASVLRPQRCRSGRGRAARARRHRRRIVAFLPRRFPATIFARRLDWATLLARVFAIDVLRCSACGGRRRVLAFLTDSTVVAKILVLLGTW